MLEWNKYISSESPCLPNASHQVSAQSDLPFGSRCRFKIFKMATKVTIHLRYWNKMNLAILNLQVTPMPPNKLNQTYRSGADMV